MNESLFRKLGITAAVMVVAAFVVGSFDARASFDASGKRNLIDQLSTADIGAIEVKSAENNELVRLERVGENFAVASKFNYPASTSEINSLIRKCIDVRTDALLSEDKADHKCL